MSNQSTGPVSISKKPLTKTVVRNSYYSTPPSSLNNREGLANYKQFCEDISQKKTVKHRVFGIGEVIAQDFDHITVQFGVKERKLSLKSMYENELLVL